MKICPLGVELFHVDGKTNRQTNTMKLTVAFGKCANAPENGPVIRLV
jgi:hypothetical protein